MTSSFLALGEALPSPTPHLVARRDGSVGWMIFNRPDRRNAISVDIWQAIPELMRTFNEDSRIRSIVLTGAGDRAFIAGADISEFDSARANALEGEAYEARNNAAYSAISSSPKPVIARINGFCIGGGVAIALACDIRIASRGSTFAIPAARLGLGYPPQAVGLLLRAISASQAKLLISTAQQVDSEEALRIGLIDRLCEKDDLDALLFSLTHTISENAPLTIAAGNMVIDALNERPTSGRDGQDAIRACFDSEDYREGRMAFMEKRKPKFQGR
ncbi:enoyl-CoA hydratase/carnithine racemase [Rhodoligotrophos appendicifer]|uniref:enoyl-CoA hydratase n=1 Tax=Rhodoligotrophos appendicifer TaxID=987056 RepID=UPI00118478D0|nr:enoyl-CoA hydratase [Rhodoligotrophos appendicifer]